MLLLWHDPVVCSASDAVRSEKRGAGAELSQAGSFAGASVRVTRPRVFELNQVDENIAPPTRDADFIVRERPG